MAVNAAQVTVSTSATSVLAAGEAGVWAVITNAGTTSVFLGGSSVGTGDGYELDSGATVRVNLNSGDEIFGIVASGTEPVHVLSS